MLPSGTISDGYGHGTNEEQVYFIQIKEAVFFSCLLLEIT
jgi:hypothetical protein